MGTPTRNLASSAVRNDAACDRSWQIVLAAAEHAARLLPGQTTAHFAVRANGAIGEVGATDSDAVLAWCPPGGWTCLLPEDDPRRALVDLYLPICNATTDRPMTIGHLGQSLDGFIATHAGESQWVTGRENILHLHRLRALCDAVVVGAGTVAADDPLLTTRLVAGPNPLRVVLDPARRLGAHHRVFNDDAAETLYVCAQSLTEPGECHVGRATIVGVQSDEAGVPPFEVLRLLRARGCARIFVEGGGVTVSMFLEANLLDRLHVAIAPLFIGDGRPAIRLEPRAALGDCHRPRYRVFRMGSDLLFDCSFGPAADDTDALVADLPPITRVI
jgi:riboflavin-specific deaminase-like protein